MNYRTPEGVLEEASRPRGHFLRPWLQGVERPAAPRRRAKRQGQRTLFASDC